MGGTPIKLPRPFDYWTTYKGHSGIDYPEPNDTLVKASGSGIVVQSGYWNPRGGWGVIVRYDNGIEWGYCHSDFGDWRIAKDRRVKLGDNIMEIGGTGLNSTGPHLHQDIRVNGVIIPPPAYWNYVDKSPNGYVGAPSSSGGNSKPLIPRRGEMDRITYQDNKKRDIYVIASFDDAIKIDHELAVIYNKASGDGGKFVKLTIAEAHDYLENVRLLRARRNKGIADEVSRELDQLIADTAE